jgi:acetylornithine/N-succinyldiaminopimelate aminotransferase
LLLIFDEVQTGVGRTGHFFAYERTGVTPDVLGLAKGLGGGFPVGACLATADAGKGMVAGTHGSTFGGNPMAMAVGNAVLDVLLAPGFLEGVRKKALLFKQRLAEIHARHSGVISEVRGDGLLLGLRTTIPNTELVDALRAEHLLAVAAGDNVVRLLPALIISDGEIGEVINRIDRAATSIERALAAKREASGATV